MLYQNVFRGQTIKFQWKNVTHSVTSFMDDPLETCCIIKIEKLNAKDLETRNFFFRSDNKVLVNEIY
jgi:hypothetical protein